MTSNATPSWVIPVVPLGAVSAGAVAWRRGGKLHISPIVKTTFAFAPGGPMTPAPPVPVRVTEQLRDPEAPESSIREGLDTVPELVRADVVFVGNACAPSGVPATHVTVRLAIRAAGAGRGGEVLLDKRLEVLGDRLLIPGRPPPEPSPFASIPMIYERTYGGPDHKPNPVGLGVMAELGGRRRLPNIVHPARSAQPTVEPAGLAPISFQWPARRRMLRATPRRALEQPVVEIPDDLDPLYFQSAPEDQRPPLLRGDEWIVLEGLHKVHASLETQLPGARGVAHVYLPDGSHRPVVMVADTLLIDGEAERCTLTWRGAFPLPSLADLPSTGVVAGVEWPGRPVVWPERFPRVARAPEAEGYPEISVVEESVAEVQPYRPTFGAPPPRPLGAVPPRPLGAAPPLPLGAAPPLPQGAAPSFGAPLAQPSGRQRTVMMEMDAPPPAPAPAAVPLAANATKTAPLAATPLAANATKTTPLEEDGDWGLGTMVLNEAEEPAPVPKPAAGGRQRTTVIGVGALPPGFPAAGALPVPPAPPPPGAPAMPAAPKFPPPQARPPLKKP
jgi:hypothetical protein